MLPKAHLILHSRISGSGWVITPPWLSGSLRSFLLLLIFKWIYILPEGMILGLVLLEGSSSIILYMLRPDHRASHNPPVDSPENISWEWRIMWIFDTLSENVFMDMLDKVMNMMVSTKGPTFLQPFWVRRTHGEWELPLQVNVVKFCHV